MDLFDVVRSCVRRWYVVIPLIVLTTAFAYHAYSSAKPVYYAQAIVGLAPQSERVGYGPGPVPVNGLLEAGGTSLIANMSTYSFRSPAVVQKVLAGGGAWSYRVTMLPGPGNAPPLPLLSIDTTQRNPDIASKTVELVVAQADEIVKNVQKQAGVPDSQLVGTTLVSFPGKPTGAMPSRIRSTASIFIGGLGLSIVTGVVIDMVLLRRRARRSRAVLGGPENSDSAGAAPDDAAQHERISSDPTGAVASNRR